MRKIAIVLMVILIPLVIFGSQITGIAVSPYSGQQTLVKLGSTGDVTFTDYSLSNPSRIVIDFVGVTNNITPEKIMINRGGITSIDITKPNDKVIRFTFFTDKDYAYNITRDSSVINLTINSGISSFADYSKKFSSDVSINPNGSEGLISLDLENADLVTVLRGLANYSGRNIIVSDKVKGTITVSLHDVPWEKALDVILKTAGYTYMIDGDIIRVGTGEEFKKELQTKEESNPLINKIFKLKFANASKIKSSLEKLLSPRGSIEVDQRTNSLIVTDIQEKLNDISKMLYVLDSPNPQVEIVVKIVEIDANFDRGLGINWNVSGLSSPNGAIKGNIKSGEEIAPHTTLNVGTVGSYVNVNAKLQMLEKENKSKVIANPRITAVNNQKASILGGKKFTVVTLDQRGNPVTQMYTVGAKIEVTPQINSLNEVTMTIHAELSTVEGAATNHPIINTTEANTKQVVKDGETVVMGGFIKSTETNSSIGLPLLRGIPILGTLFGTKTKQNDRKEVLIFLTPHIIK